jgi:hypothetical protein
VRSDLVKAGMRLIEDAIRPLELEMALSLGLGWKAWEESLYAGSDPPVRAMFTVAHAFDDLPSRHGMPKPCATAQDRVRTCASDIASAIHRARAELSASPLSDELVPALIEAEQAAEECTNLQFQTMVRIVREVNGFSPP